MARFGTLVRSFASTGRATGLFALEGRAPTVAEGAFVAPTASVVGDVSIGSGSSVWYNCVVRGDVNRVTIGRDTNIQDGTVIHVARNNAQGLAAPTTIGDRVTVGHMALLHACTIEDEAFIGMGSVVMDGAVVQTGAMVAAGALVPPGKTIPTGQLWAGRPARYHRDLKENEKQFICGPSAQKYCELAEVHAKGLEEITH